MTHINDYFPNMIWSSREFSIIPGSASRANYLPYNGEGLIFVFVAKNKDILKDLIRD